MITREKARRLRQLIEMMSEALTDSEALEGIELFPVWKNDHLYEVGNRVRYGDTLYKCLTSHASQSTWVPADSPSLWVRVDNPAEEFPEWVQPLGATDAYAMGAKVSHLGKHWQSDYDANIWEPGVFGWSEV